MRWFDRKRPESTPPLPPPNTYWVEPGRLLAGEYPGTASRAESMERLQALLRAGVESFVDLTEPDEAPEYEPLLAELTERRIRYRRLPVQDHGLPQSPAHMAQIVDALEAELARGRCVYLHCRAGIGRTGTAAACHLIRGGMSNDQALEHLQTLWRQCTRSRRWPNVPETPEQVEFVRTWRDATRTGETAASLESRYEGALVGLAVGEALGALADKGEFAVADIGAGARMSAGAHTATTRALAESLLTLRAHDPKDQLQRYLHWTRSVADAPVPAELKRALAAWQWSGKPNAGSHDPANLDSHSLPRTLAVALVFANQPDAAITNAAECSRPTQQAPVVLDLCRVWAGELLDALAGASGDELRRLDGPAMRRVRGRALKQQVQSLLAGRPPELGEPGDALDVTHMAIASFARTSSLRDALLDAASARAHPTAMALCGALCGAYYGAEAIPLDWRRLVLEESALRTLALRLLS